jgi:hypothetical protein
MSKRFWRYGLMAASVLDALFVHLTKNSIVFDISSWQKVPQLK